MLTIHVWPPYFHKFLRIKIVKMELKKYARDPLYMLRFVCLILIKCFENINL